VWNRGSAVPHFKRVVTHQGESMGHKKGGNRRGTEHKKDKQCVCQWCGESFWASRATAKTCCDNHRSLLSKYVEKHGRKPDRPMHNGYSYGRYTPRRSYAG